MSAGETNRPEEDYNKACDLMWEHSAPNIQHITDIEERTRLYTSFCLGWKAALMADYCIRKADRELKRQLPVERIVKSFLGASVKLNEADSG